MATTANQESDARRTFVESWRRGVAVSTSSGVSWLACDRLSTHQCRHRRRDDLKASVALSESDATHGLSRLVSVAAAYTGRVLSKRRVYLQQRLAA